jgi:UDPglucose--hexose-1-phosphate uridylyltransferase
MPELRYNIASREWVVFATERAKRPRDFVKAKKEGSPLPEYKENCPFCPGNEKLSPAEVFRLGDERRWQVRSVPNLYGALSAKERPERKINGMYISMGGFGSHEVIIENPRHNTCIALMQDSEVEDVIASYKSRYLSLQDAPGIESIVIFKNHGPAAGTSMEHPHSQLIATPIVPPNIRNRLEIAADYFDNTGRCLYCQTLEEELKAKSRLVLETENFVSFLAYAGLLPFLTWVVPRRHVSAFSEINDDEVRDLARHLRALLAKFYHGLDNPDFNYTIRSSPAKEKQTEYSHWHLNVIPRLSQPAGFELGSGMFINTSLPEEGAEFLRQVR